MKGVRKIVRGAGLTMRDGNGLELGHEFRLIPNAACRQLVNEPPISWPTLGGRRYLFRRHYRLSFFGEIFVVNRLIVSTMRTPTE